MSRLTTRPTQRRLVYESLYRSCKTMKEVTADTGIVREFVCWYIRALKLEGLVYHTKIRKCTESGYDRVKEWTTNPDLVPNMPKQGRLFE